MSCPVWLDPKTAVALWRKETCSPIKAQRLCVRNRFYIIILEEESYETKDFVIFDGACAGVRASSRQRNGEGKQLGCRPTEKRNQKRVSDTKWRD